MSGHPRVLIIAGDEESRRELRRRLEDAGLGSYATIAESDDSTGSTKGSGWSNPGDLNLLWQRIEERMGMCPSFFRLARHEPAIAWALFGLAEFAYLDSPIPSRFKEQLFTYLSRFCPVPYCLGRHCAFLLGRGNVAGDEHAERLSPEEARRLLDEPLPAAEDLDRCLDSLERHPAPIEDWPSWSSDLGYQLRVACAHVFLHSYRAKRGLLALRRLLGPARYEQLALFLGFIGMAHFWTEVHPEIRTEPDVQKLLTDHQSLAPLLGDGTSRDTGMEARAIELLHAELGDLRRRTGLARLLGELTDALPAHISYVDAEQRFVFANHAYVETYQRSRDRIVGRHVSEVLGEKRYADVRSKLEAALDGQQIRFAYKLTRPSHADRDLDVSYVPHRLADGTIAGCFVLAADVTEHKRSERALARSEARLEEAARRKDEYLAMLGHELRNPLAAMQHATELVQFTAKSDTRLERAAGVLARQSNHMARLIDGLLEVSRIARGKLDVDRVKLDVREVCEGVIEDRRAQIEARGLQLTKHLSSRPVRARADRVRLAQVIDNLVGNALKFTPPPGVITVEVTEDDEHAVIRVRDTGVGIRPEALSHVFEPFYQEAQDVARASGGLGLGLALARGLVELHDGTLEAYSDGPGSGTQFTVRLPLETDAAVEGELPTQQASAVRKVLLVEDNPDAAIMLRELLELRGHAVDIAETGAEALEILRRDAKEIVLCDIGLPGMSGYDLAQAIRGDPSLRDTRLVALTGYGQPEDREQSARAGFDAHVTKPVTMAELEEVLAGFPPTTRPRR